MSDREQHDLSICMPIDGHGDMDDLDWRHNLENAIDEILAKEDNGECDGADIGSGTMNIGVCVYDFDAALAAIVPLLMQWEAPDGTIITRSNLYQIVDDAPKLNGYAKMIVWPPEKAKG